MSIVVTGAAGFIGSHLAKRLEDAGEKLILLDDFSRGKQEYLDYLGVKTPCQKVDLKVGFVATHILEGADTVYHCACRIGGMQFLHGSPEKELKALQDNVLIDTNVFRACVKNKIKKVIYTSSVSVYTTKGQYGTDSAIFRESWLDSMLLDPEGGYGWAKFIGEKHLDFLREYGIKIGIARIFKSYGPCDDYSPESGQVVLSLMRKLMKDNDFVVWGSGNVSRCLVYIDDLVDALIKIANYDESLTVNIGGFVPHKIKDLAKEIVSVSGKDVKIKFDKKKPEGPQSRIPDLSKARKELNWKPTTSLNEGLKKCWTWMEQEFDN